MMEEVVHETSWYAFVLRDLSHTSILYSKLSSLSYYLGALHTI